MAEKTYFPGDPVFNPSYGELWVSRLSLIPAVVVVAILAVQYAAQTREMHEMVEAAIWKAGMVLGQANSPHLMTVLTVKLPG